MAAGAEKQRGAVASVEAAVERSGTRGGGSTVVDQHNSFLYSLRRSILVVVVEKQLSL